FLAMYFMSGASPLTFDMTVLRSAAFSGAFQRLYFPFLFLGFGTLAGFWPFHTWSPDGHASAPTAVSMLHAGVLMKLGAYGIIRVGLEMMPDGARAWLPFFGMFTLVNITYGAICAMSQTDLKYVTAYSSVSHMGIVILGISTLTDAGLNGAVLQMFSHGIMTGLFFALIGFTYEKTHTRIIAEYGGLGKRMPVIATFFTLGGLASLGLPGLSGFVAEFLVFVGAWRFNPLMAVIAAIGIVFTAAYVLRVLQRCFWGPLNPHFADLPDARPVEILCLTILSLFIVGIGMFPRPLVALINSGVQTVLTRVAVAAAAATGVGPVAG
ncbi:MAG: NADH-quinone oxidoreductase subunit M, partial [bacterium]